MKHKALAGCEVAFLVEVPILFVIQHRVAVQTVIQHRVLSRLVFRERANLALRAVIVHFAARGSRQSDDGHDGQELNRHGAEATECPNNPFNLALGLADLEADDSEAGQCAARACGHRVSLRIVLATSTAFIRAGVANECARASRQRRQGHHGTRLKVGLGRALELQIHVGAQLGFQVVVDGGAVGQARFEFGNGRLQCGDARLGSHRHGLVAGVHVAVVDRKLGVPRPGSELGLWQRRRREHCGGVRRHGEGRSGRAGGVHSAQVDGLDLQTFPIPIQPDRVRAERWVELRDDALAAVELVSESLHLDALGHHALAINLRGVHRA
mmetsp:Transcript_8127/g.20815  ORF Transcript_8127/g.20815 Transcript_8127/m.20815 type:complete len:326 (-) Transcript_8127:491-1468(-)